MIYLLYDIMLLLSMFVVIPWYVIRGFMRGKMRQGLRERLGILPRAVLQQVQGRPVIWIHAVSVGETRAAIPLIKRLRREYPDHVLLLSNVTETGREIAESIPEVDVRIYFPIDLSFLVQKLIRTISPKMVIIVETELWPQFIRACGRQKIPVLLVNGRISDRSFPRYRKVKKFIRPVLSQVESFCMQSDEDARRIKHLGADGDKVRVNGNIKFDMDIAIDVASSAADIRRQLGIDAQRPVWVAGSTHEGEEQAILNVYAGLLSSCHDLVLILVPRHPHRSSQIAQVLNDAGISYRLRSDNDAQPLGYAEVILGDTLGEMLQFYAAADIVFVGGSLVPVGGHNILEASLLEKPVIFGSYMHNFREIAKYVNAAQGFGEVHNAAELEALMLRLLRDKDAGILAGEKAAGILHQHAGASERTMAVVRQLLEG